MKCGGPGVEVKHGGLVWGEVWWPGVEVKYSGLAWG